MATMKIHLELLITEFLTVLLTFNEHSTFLSGA